MAGGEAEGDGLCRRESELGVGSRKRRVLSPDMYSLYGRFLEAGPAGGAMIAIGRGEGGGLCMREFKAEVGIWEACRVGPE